MDCGDKGVLQSWHMRRGPSNKSIYYEYTCCKGSWIILQTTSTHVTPWQLGTDHEYLGELKRKEEACKCSGVVSCSELVYMLN